MLERYLDPWSKEILAKGNPPDLNDLDLPLAVLVDDRPTLLLRFCVLNTILMGRCQISLRLYTSSSNFDETKDLFNDLEGWVEIYELNQDVVKDFGKNEYNQLLISSDFWRGLPSQKILIVQTDSLLIEPIDFSMFVYDYIGAPFSKGKIRQTFFPAYSENLLEERGSYWFTQQYNLDKNVTVPIGNGGLSIRNRDLMLFISENEQAKGEENEDVFFCRYLGKYNANLPPLCIARRFACEAQYSVSIGSHASHIYLSCKEQAEIYDRHFKHLIGMVFAKN